MIVDLKYDSLWKHLENAESTRISYEVEQERTEIIKFIDNVLKEGRHINYIDTILGSDHTDEKIQVLMGEEKTQLYLKLSQQP